MKDIDGGLRKLFMKHVPKAHWQPIESGGIGSGIPDSNGCLAGVEFWVEFKQTSAWAVEMRPEQVAWIHRRYRNGGNTWIAVRRVHDGGPRLGPPVDQLWLVSGQFVCILEENGLRLDPDLIAGMWTGGPKNWDWLRVTDFLGTRNGADVGTN